MKTFIPAPLRFASRVFIATAAGALSIEAADTVLHHDNYWKNGPISGIPYFLPEARLIVTSEPVLNDEKEIIGLNVSVAQKRVADRSQAFTLHPEKGVFTADQTKLVLSDGMLSTVGTETEGKLGEALSDIASFYFSLQTIPALGEQLNAAGLLDSAVASNYSSGSTQSDKQWILGSGANINITNQQVTRTRDSLALTIVEWGEQTFGPAIAQLAFSGFDDAAIAEAVGRLREAHNNLKYPVTPKEMFDELVADNLRVTRTIDPLELNAAGDPQTQFDIELSDAVKIRLSIDWLVAGDRIPRRKDTTWSDFKGPETKSLATVHRGPRQQKSLVKFDPTFVDDAVFVRSERGVKVRVELLPVSARVQRIRAKSVEAQIGVLKSDLKAIANGNSDTGWLEHVKTEQAKLTARMENLKTESQQVVDKLLQWAGGEASLTDGNAAFRVTVFGEYLKRIDAAQLGEAAKIEARAKVLSLLAQSSPKSLALKLIELWLLTKAEPPSSFEEMEPFYVRESLATVPTTEVYLVPLEQLALGKNSQGLVLQQGVIREYTSTRTAPGAEFTKIPAKIIGDYVQLLKEIITIRVATNEATVTRSDQQLKLAQNLQSLAALEDASAKEFNEQKATLESQTALLKLELELAKVQQAAAPSAASIEHESRKEALQRQLDLLTLESQINELGN